MMRLVMARDDTRTSRAPHTLQVKADEGTHVGRRGMPGRIATWIHVDETWLANRLYRQVELLYAYH